MKMKVEQLMSRPVVTCQPDDDLGHAAGLMWDRDCGVLAVVDDSRQVVGMITDRDICMAALTQGTDLGVRTVDCAMAHDVYRCRPTDDLEAAEELMAEHQVRRLPVVDDRGHLVGILSMADIIQHRGSGTRRKAEFQRTVETMSAITRPRERAWERGAAE